MLYFDLDGILRDLHLTVMGRSCEQETQWSTTRDGLDYPAIVKNDPTVLTSAPRTKYFPIIVNGWCLPIRLITCQPEDWRDKTALWLAKNLRSHVYSVIYVNDPCEKLDLLKPGDLLVEDYPMFPDYSQIVLVSYPYNRKVENPRMRINTPTEMKAFLEEHWS